MLKFKKTFVRVFAFNLLGVLLGPMIFFVPSVTDASGWTTITTSISNAIALSSSTNFSDGAPTTEQLASKGGVTFIAGELLESSNPGSEIFIGPKKETEYEWNLVVTAAATPGTAYILRVSNNG